MARRRFKYLLLHSIGVPVTAAVAHGVRLTMRIEYRNDERIAELAREGRRFILSFWHEDIPIGFFAARHMVKRGVGFCATLTSLSNDGEFLTRCVHAFGLETVRGSTSRGGRQALKEIEAYLKTRGHMGVAVDGPRGPRHKAKLGVAICAKDTGAWILPFSAEYGGAWRLWKSWDKSAIPKPFSRCVCTFHEPFPVPPDAGREALEAACLRLEQALGDPCPTPPADRQPQPSS